MYSEFNTFSFLGMSNTELFLSEKDLKAMEFNFLVRPTMEFPDECQIAPSEDGELHQQQQQQQQQQKQEQEEEKEEKYCQLVVSSLELKVPSQGEFKVDEDDDHNAGLRTPTSSDHRIPLILKCPPAPRKPKSLPSTKRKAPRRQIVLDLSKEIESLFPPALFADLGGKIKKVRKGNGTK